MSQNDLGAPCCVVSPYTITGVLGSPLELMVVVTLGQKYNVGEKPTVIELHIYINHHTEPPNC